MDVNNNYQTVNHAIRISDSLFSGNKGNKGGAIFAGDNAGYYVYASIVNTTFYQNTGVYGSAFYMNAHANSQFIA